MRQINDTSDLIYRVYHVSGNDRLLLAAFFTRMDALEYLRSLSELRRSYELEEVHEHQSIN